MTETASTAQRLLDAASEEFNEHGYGGTDSNKIARRAGFAPQTFYRWYADKTEIFIAVYEAWEAQERGALEALADKHASRSRMVETIVRQHRQFRIFRRSLRLLAVENPQVRKARARSRKRQTDAILKWQNLPEQQRDLVLVRLLQIERLADALAEGELKDLGVAEAAAKKQMAALLGIDARTSPRSH